MDNPKTIKLVVADTFIKRIIGLLGKKSLPAGEAWVFYNCRAVHTLGMRFKIDILFYDKEGRFLSSRNSVPPARLIIGPAGSATTLECNSGEWYLYKDLVVKKV